MHTAIHRIIRVMVFLTSINILSPGYAHSPDLTAKSAILIEAQTGKVLCELNADERRAPASTTKIMTLIIALENTRLDDIVTASASASQTEGSTMWLYPGEKMRVLDLLYGIMLVSGNDATVAIAEHIAGSVSGFATLMNGKAADIGVHNTNFTNPHGLPDNLHYSTARDLALIAAYGYKNPVFEHIVGTISKVMPWPGKDHDRELWNENKLLWTYEGGNGVKTGYTEAAGRCLVAAAKRNGVQLIAVVLDSDYMWTDSIKMLDYGFTQVEPYKIIKQGDIFKTVYVKYGKQERLTLVSVQDVVVAAGLGERDKFTSVVETDRVVAPVLSGQKLGRVKIMYEGKEVAGTDLVATADVERRSFFGMLWGQVWNVFNSMIKNFA